MLKKILEIGKELEKSEFSPKSCVEILKSIEVTSNLEDFNKELGKWLLTNKLPTQLNVYNHFGQPPVTIFNNEKFVVDIYFWMHADTSLHSHAFSGAFKVLYGQSLHEEFSIETKEQFSKDIHLNDLTRIKSEILNSEDIREITSGDNFNHRVIHLSSPTVTLCIRSVKDTTIPQWHHFDNGLSILKRELDESIFKKMFYADYLAKFSIENTTNFTQDFINTLDLSEAMNLFEQLTVDTMGLSQEYQEVLFNIMMGSLGQQNWFTLYDESCNTELVQHEPDANEEERLVTHLNNYGYSESEAVSLFEQL